jgi:hypothetical protein
MIPLGLVEVSRTGIVAIGRGPEGHVTPIIPARLVPAGHRT